MDNTGIMQIVKSAFSILMIAVIGWVFPACTASLPKTEKEARSLYDRLDQALSVKPPEAPDKADEWCNAKVYLRKAQFLLEAREAGDDWLPLAGRELQNAEQALARILSPAPLPVITGFREEGYYCDNDDSFQPFLRYIPDSYKPGQKQPLMIFLHGYSPALNLVNWQGIPQCLIDLADREGWLVANPFGRSNTDYQGIGEQDVLRVVDEMARRYSVDEDRVILTGFSMGGTGVWCVGARHPDRFAGLLTMAGRGDYYFWHGLRREEVPEYKRRLIDVEFAGPQAHRLASSAILSAHGALDTIVPVEEARYMAKAVKKVNPDMIYLEFPEGGHGGFDEVFSSSLGLTWLKNCRRPEQPIAPVQDPVSVKTAFLSPFIYVFSGNPGDSEHRERFEQAVTDWFRFAKAPPRMTVERSITTNQLASFNLFLFGEPENSRLIREVLAQSPVKVTARAFVVGRKTFPRQGNGLYLVRPNPWNPRKLAVVQCGERWGAGIYENHKYDFLPAYIVYNSGFDDDGSNTALIAGFFDKAWRLVE